jgi:hypothetical protein
MYAATEEVRAVAGAFVAVMAIMLMSIYNSCKDFDIGCGDDNSGGKGEGDGNGDSDSNSNADGNCDGDNDGDSDGDRDGVSNGDGDG